MKTKIAFSLLILLSFLICSCSESPFVNLDALRDSLQVKQFPEQKDFPDDDAVVLSEVHDEQITVESGTGLVTTVKTQYVEKLFKNIDKYSDVEIVLPSGNKVSNINARIIKPDGKIIVLGSGDFHEISINNKFYNTAKIVKFTFPSVEKNSIVEYDYKVDIDVPFMTDVWYIQGNIPKLRNVFKLTAPHLHLDGWGWTYKDYNCNVPDPVIENSYYGAYRYSTFSWKQTNIPAFKPEPMMPAKEYYIRYVKFKPEEWKTWNDVTGWFYKLLINPVINDTNKITGETKELVKNCDNEVDKIKCVYSLVESFDSAGVEKGNTKPDKKYAELRKKFKNYEDKGLLIITMLKILGIEAKPVMALTRDIGFIDPDFPCWNFNKMIIKITTKDKKDIWADPDLKYCGLGFLPYNCENSNALVINNDGTSHIEVTPKSPLNENNELVYEKLDYTKTDSVSIGVSIKFQGQYNFIYKNILKEKTPKEIKAFCKEMLSDKFINAEIVDYSIVNLDSIDFDLRLSFRAVAPYTFTRQGDLIFFNPDPLKLSGNWNWLGDQKRKYDVELDYPFVLNKTLEVLLPENKYNIKGLPANIINSHGDPSNFIRDYNVYGDNKIIVKEVLTLSDNIIQAENYKNLQEFINSIKTRMEDHIVLSGK